MMISMVVERYYHTKIVNILHAEAGVNSSGVRGDATISDTTTVLIYPRLCLRYI